MKIKGWKIMKAMIAVSLFMAGCARSEVIGIYEEKQEEKEYIIVDKAPAYEVKAGNKENVPYIIAAGEKDFDRDYMPVLLQRHTEGKGGMKLLMIPEGFDCSEGDKALYEERVRDIGDYVFTIEPLTRLRGRFDIYYLPLREAVMDCLSVTASGGIYSTDANAVMNITTKTLTAAACVNGEIVGETISVFDGGGNPVGSMNNTVFGAVTVIVKKERGTGRPPADTKRVRTCTYQYDSHFCASIIPVGEDEDWDYLEWITHHEVCGHGIGLLEDEYDIDDIHRRNVFQKVDKLEACHLAGKWLNVDTHADPMLTPWRDFVGMEEYADEKIGAYEGAAGSYSKGIYRPTENSLMRDSRMFPEFNAPCRWFIYKRVMENTGGKADFKEFVQKDLQERQE